MFDIPTTDTPTTLIAYCFDDECILAGCEPCHLDPLESEAKGEPVWLLPGKATLTAPGEEKEGYAQKWNGDAWEYLENHKGETGWVNGEFVTITEYGGYQEGWSDTSPLPTPEEIAVAQKAAILSRLCEIDAETIRPLRSLASGDAVDADSDKLAALDAEAATLRAELADLS